MIKCVASRSLRGFVNLNAGPIWSGSHATNQDETEIVFGQKMTARYHETDTWMHRNGQWQIVAGQVLRYYEDPAEGRYDPKKIPDFVGTYQLGDGSMTLSASDGKLYAQRAGRTKNQLLPEAPDVFFIKSRGKAGACFTVALMGKLMR